MTNKQERKVAFITGASRGIGAESAVALAKAGWDVAITARTLNEGEVQIGRGQPSSASSLTAQLRQWMKLVVRRLLEGGYP